MLAAVFGHGRTRIKTAENIGQADDGQGPARHRWRQAAQIHFTRQMRHQESDVETAGEEAGMQQPVAAVGEGVADGLLQTGVGFWVRVCRMGFGGELADQRQGGQREHGGGPHRAHPAQALDQLLDDRCKHELTKRATCIDHARGRATRLCRHALGGRTDEHRKTRRA